MRYAKIVFPDTANGIGVRVSLFLQGCSRHCKNCFNQDTWDPSGGKLFTEADKLYIMTLLAPDYVDGLSILGGEPLEQAEELADFLQFVKEAFPDKDIWLWTGNVYESVQNLRVFDYVDIVVDGAFIEELKVPLGSAFYGSSNQRIIKISKED